MSHSVATRGILLAWAVGALAPGVPPPFQPAPPPSPLPLRLTGVIVDGVTPSRSACLIHCLDRPERGLFVAGDRVCDVASVRAIRSDGVVIENLRTGRPELLAFGPASAPNRTETAEGAVGSGSVPSVAAPASADGASPAAPEVYTIALARAVLAGELANLPVLLDSATATPRYRDAAEGRGVIDGYEIGRLRPASLLDRLGLRNGDVVLEVNGHPLDGMATVMRLFGQLGATTRTEVVVLRDGRRVTFVVEVR